ncbi:hypothetical protein [Pedobacter heparinus]|uniref:hypothetical protein n=1 Tax=Pedobacter heparinus TaxID=984 RepID=UPI0029317439|nr:hypothetical protein [Pedobacter heparinus]
MKNLSLRIPAWMPVVKNTEPYLVALIMLLLWFTAPKLMMLGDGTMGQIDQSIWLLVLLALISFLIVTGLCWWLLQRFWTVIGLPGLGMMVLQFNSLQLWQQLGFYFASFGLLLWAAVGCLSAIC